MAVRGGEIWKGWIIDEGTSLDDVGVVVWDDNLVLWARHSS